MTKIIKLSNGGTLHEYTNGDRFWFLNGNLHREDGPAIELANGDKCWVLDGRFQRADSPTVEYFKSILIK
jgi:hypothetical protein